VSGSRHHVAPRDHQEDSRTDPNDDRREFSAFQIMGLSPIHAGLWAVPSNIAVVLNGSYSPEMA